MSAISTHVLDLATGRPAAGIAVRLERREGPDRWRTLGESATDADGRARDLLGGAPSAPGVHRLTFATGDWLRTRNGVAFYPEVSIVFDVLDASQHHHVPLLLSPFGYSTYRGS